MKVKVPLNNKLVTPRESEGVGAVMGLGVMEDDRPAESSKSQ
jgi:hypothetical protein